MSNNTAKAFAAGLVLVFLITATSAYAQPAMKEVSGTYVNSATGVEMTFPSGFSGFEIAAGTTTIVSTSPGGMSESDPATMKTITLIIADKSTNKNPRDPGSFSNDVNNCNDPAVTSRTVSGVQAIELTADCPSTSQKFKMVSLQTSSNWIAVMYMAPIADFESQVASYDSAVSSLTVQGAMNADASAGGKVNLGLELKSVIQSVLVKGRNVDISVLTNSTITNFKLEEQSKKLSFTVDGQSGTRGSTEIPIGKVLEGPYTVAIDGQSTTDFQVTNQGSADAVIKISYTHSTHDVSVTGTNVVPEFPVVMVGTIAAIIGLAAVVGRAKLFGTRM